VFVCVGGGVDPIDEKFIDGWNYFATLSPFIIKEYETKEKFLKMAMENEKIMFK
jgi:hypothetical protein